MSRQTHNRVYHFFNSRIFIGAALIVLSFMTYATIKEIRQRYTVEREIDLLRGEVDALESQNMELSRLLEYFQTDSFVEREGRSKLNLALPGEEVVIIPQDDNQSLDYGTGSSGIEIDREIKEESKDVRNSKKWWAYFFGKRLVF